MFMNFLLCLKECVQTLKLGFSAGEMGRMKQDTLQPGIAEWNPEVVVLAHSGSDHCEFCT